MDDVYGGCLEKSLDARSVHLFIAQEHAVLERASVLSTGDAVRLTSAGGRRLMASAGPGTEIPRKILRCRTLQGGGADDVLCLLN